MLLPHRNDSGAFSSSTLIEENMDITTLRSAYLCGQTSPSEQVERFLAQCQDPDWAGLWIELVNANRLRQQAWDVEERWRVNAADVWRDRRTGTVRGVGVEPSDPSQLPLYGVLFAVKDNI